MKPEEAASMPRMILLAFAALSLAACAQINKPIGPNDDWDERATALPTPGTY